MPTFLDFINHYPAEYSLLILLAFIFWRAQRSYKQQAIIKPIEKIPEINWHSFTIEQAIAQLDSNINTGLNDNQVNERLKTNGLNQLTQKPPEAAWHLFVSQFKSVLILVLVVAAILATAIGHISDGIVILIVVMINAVLGFYQEFQAEKSLLALKKMLSLQAKVRRNEQIVIIPAEQLVIGDIVLLEAGNKIPADGRLIIAHSVEVDESALTGESLPVAKQTAELEDNTLLAERVNMLYMNNALTRGRAEMLVTATGMATQIGKLAALLAQSDDENTPLQIQLDSLGKRLSVLALAIVALLFASALWRGEELINTAFTAIALAVAAIPEGLPAVVTVTLALGMRRMANQRAIMKRLSAVETLGCTTVICTDKTGTLTVNQMTARSVFYRGQLLNASGEGYDTKGEISPSLSSEELKPLLLALVLCNDSQLQNQQILGDPMEAALLVLAAKAGMTQAQANEQLPRIAEIPFDAQYKFMASFHQTTEGVQVFVKGAPEVILSFCQFENAQQPTQLLKQNEAMASQGLRVLGIATTTLSHEDFNAHDLFGHISQLAFVALVGLIDPPRTEVKAAIELCKQAGIAVKMITGDQKITASAIAQELGLTGEVIAGAELAQWDDATLAKRINDIAVFARTAPEQKMRLVNALKADGHVVAMTGDGINDAPALKSADIGIAMGITGTDVAQEAASMILTDDNFATIVTAVKEGRGIYENMVKFIRFQLSTNIGAILCVTFAPLLHLPLPFTAIQLLWINIIMDGPPAMSLGVDPTSMNSMQQAPRDPAARILSWRRFANLLSYGVIMTLGTLGILAYDLTINNSQHATTLAFTTFVLFQIFNAFNARSEHQSAFNKDFFHNKILWLSLIGVVTLQSLIIEYPAAQAIFKTTDLSLNDWLIAIGIASFVLVFEEFRKLVWKKLL
ncbi:MAG: calcium-translocating P-type ATPase, PMCA-type [Methylococcaceae bacterium]